MEISKIDNEELYSIMMPKDSDDFNKKLNNLIESTIKHYTDTMGMRYPPVPKAVYRQVLRRAILGAALYKISDDIDFMNQLALKLTEISGLDYLANIIRC